MRPCLFFVLLVVCASCQRKEPVNAVFQTPGELTAEASRLQLKKVFVNPGAQRFFRDAAFAKISPEDQAALQSPGAWRKLDRRQRFDGVLLAGPSGEYLSVLKHLSTSPDFRLVRVDNWGALFVRGTPQSFRPDTPDAITKQFSNATDRGRYLAQTALNLDAAGLGGDGRAFLSAALSCAPREPDVRVAAAAFELSHGRSLEAIRQANEALTLRPSDLAALEIKARAYFAAQAFDQAWSVATELKNRASPEDMNVLFLHARIANAAHAYQAEEDSLLQLLKLAGKHHLADTDYRIYLGQCYARQGLARPALEQLEIAAKDASLSDQQRKDVAQALATVRSRAGQSAP